jgi:hypothetical protein
MGRLWGCLTCDLRGVARRGECSGALGRNEAKTAGHRKLASRWPSPPSPARNRGLVHFRGRWERRRTHKGSLSSAAGSRCIFEGRTMPEPRVSVDEVASHLGVAKDSGNGRVSHSEPEFENRATRPANADGFSTLPNQRARPFTPPSQLSASNADRTRPGRPCPPAPASTTRAT